MCGHVFIYNKNKNIDENLLTTLTDKISHRGPNDTGYFIKDNIGFGFKRLSIIDVENGKQPYQKNSTTIIFNGEIYNHQELRKDLEQKGYKFETDSDTEVLLTSYLEYKEECTKHLRGMFAFVIYDEDNKKIFGARDHFGIKPLYYIENEEEFVFASEYKAVASLLNNNVDESRLQNYLSFQFVPRNRTMMSAISKIPNGTSFTIENGVLNLSKYHEVKFENNKDISKEDIVDVISDSISKHMISNVEVGTFLSGGIDSTIVATMASKINPNIKSFSVGFGVNGYDELSVAKKTADALGIENIQINVSQEDYIKALPQVIYSLDDPLADPSCVGIYFLSKEASKHVTVVLSGEGADELFGGYNIYKEYNSVKPFLSMPNQINSALNKMAKSMPKIKGKNYLLRATTPLKQRYIGNAKIFENEEIKSIMKNYNEDNQYHNLLEDLYIDCDLNNYDYVTTMQNIDINTWLEGDILLKADKMSMASSLELRVPFLDKGVLEVARNLKLDQKISKNNTKVLLREAFKDIIPSHMVEKKKLGFPTPIRVWLKEDLGDYVRKTIVDASVDSLINKEYAINLLDEHIKGKKDNSRKIWTIFVFCLWHQIFIEQVEMGID
ncbi:MAG: asparagine synthase (glutamine-hydrolyzing) [Peptostreptococcaceae bacterium]